MKNRIVTITCGRNNCYVLVNDEQKQAVLVDTGIVNHRELILQKIKDYPIKLIIITHGHIDHIENAQFFKQYFGAKIAMHEKDIPLISDNLCRPILAINMLGKFIKSQTVKLMKRRKIEPFDVDVLLEDGQSLEEYGVNAKIVVLPGHTVGSIGIQSGNRSFIVGDTLMNFLSPSPSLIMEDVELLRSSIECLKESQAEMFYVGHGKKIPYNKIF